MKYVLYVCLVLCVAQMTLAVGVIPRPIKALYIDWKAVDWAHPETTVLNSFNSGWNVVIIAFYLSDKGPVDIAGAWQGVSSVTKQATMNAIHAKGGVVLVSLGGSTDNPFGKDPTVLGREVARWALDNYLDGVDFDLENFKQGFIGAPNSSHLFTEAQTIQWVADLTNACRTVLGPSGIISHAPQSPYMGPVGATNTWAGTGGGYIGVYAKAPSIDFFNVQFYNQVDGCYIDYDGLFEMSCPELPQTSVNQIALAGIPLQKIVVGKYINVTDASNGWIAPNILNTYVSKAQKNLGWNAGVMAWAWGDASQCATWINAVYPIAC